MSPRTNRSVAHASSSSGASHASYGELPVDYPDLGRQLLLVNGAREEVTDEACAGEAMLELGLVDAGAAGAGRSGATRK